MISLQVETTAADWEALSRYAVGNVPGFLGKASRGFSWRSIALGIPAGLLIGGSQLISFSTHTPTVVLVAVVFVAYWGFLRSRYRRALMPVQGGAMVGPRTILLDEAGVGEEGAHYKSQCAWPGILAVGETNDHVFLMVDRIAGFIVPKRAFTDSVARDQFLAFARSHVSTATASSS